MSEKKLASIIIVNYNYGRFLKQAIESALSQTYPHTEVIVVDDGSTDNSREIITSYDGRIIPVVKQNGGQGSAFNSGFTVSGGNIVCFLDSDDELLPSTLEMVVNHFSDPEVVKVHWPLWIINSEGRKTGRIKEPVLPEGDFRAVVMSHGPMSELTLPSAPTSGNAYARAFLEQVLPMPEAKYRVAADAYLFGLAPAFGRIKRLAEPQGLWRSHDQNTSRRTCFEIKLRDGAVNHEELCLILSRVLQETGIQPDLESWRAAGWWPRINLSIQEITALIPEGKDFILADGDGWGTDEFIAGRRRISFIERDGKYWGAPDDDETAIDELERLRESGAGFIVFGWPVFWWFDYYRRFYNYLRSRYGCALENDRIVAFDLQQGASYQ
ncbi:MAG: glycosyltransferase family 2 protein [Acidobacteriota bacterium]